MSVSLILILPISLFYNSQVVSGLSCVPCGSTPCEVPSCCESGFYALDACGCCPICPNTRGADCGGPFDAIGPCDVGLSCLRKCECQTIQNIDCVFPFKYKGLTYTKCTKDHSENGQPWCATEVNPQTNVVIDGKWGDCQEGCDGTDFVCDEGFLFNIEGKCVNRTEANLFRNSGRILPAFQLEKGIDARTAEKAPRCNNKGQNIPGVGEHCRCAKNVLSGHPERNGGCKKTLEEQDDPEDDLAFGWCFLENVQNYLKPTENCFEDVQWSPTNGRFWSNEACRPGAVPELENELPFDPENLPAAVNIDTDDDLTDSIIFENENS